MRVVSSLLALGYSLGPSRVGEEVFNTRVEIGLALERTKGG